MTERINLVRWRPLLPYGYSYKVPVPDRVKPPFVIFDIRAHWRPVSSQMGRRFSFIMPTYRTYDANVLLTYRKTDKKALQ